MSTAEVLLAIVVCICLTIITALLILIRAYAKTLPKIK